MAFWAFHTQAEQGDARMQTIIGHKYRLGLDVQQNYLRAAYWFLKAAMQGLDRAQYGLGKLYSSGQGVEQNYILAHMWLTLAAAQGHQGAVRVLELLVKKMTPAQIAEAKLLAAKFKPKKERR